ncbi:MAG: hypothetical protein KHX14_05820 [[Clostridium] spiroforme]|uniref:Uncharacterized protein n=1 Tax=Thomasclavelia spiroformis TaxID=29348 RepID=A0A943I452_9FIRM|nr:hypothetical protein [Thomasclavelia spiroformis]MBS5588322.1 hypothetical protein [Thomasclavelia spiroformis]
MAEKLKVLDYAGLDFMLQQIKKDFVTRDEFEYVPIAITSFTNNKNTVEMGTKITDVILNWALNKDPKEMMIDSESITPLTTRSKTYSGQNITTNKTYTLKVTDEKDASATKTTSITFVNGVYWGAKAAPSGAYDSAFILGLTKGLQGSKGKTFTVDAAAGQHIFYALPTRYGACTFNVGGFDGGFTKVSTIEFTNASGYKENYDIYKSVNAGLGNTTVTVK